MYTHPFHPPKKERERALIGTKRDCNVKWKYCDWHWCKITKTEMNPHTPVKRISLLVSYYLCNERKKPICDSSYVWGAGGRSLPWEPLTLFCFVPQQTVTLQKHSVTSFPSSKQLALAPHSPYLIRPPLSFLPLALLSPLLLQLWPRWPCLS